VVERAEGAETQRKELSTNQTELRKEVAKWVAEKAVEEVEAGRGVIWVSRTEKATHDFDFLSTVSSIFLGSLPSTQDSTGYEVPEPIIVLTSTPPEVRPALVVVHSKDDKLAKTIKERLAEVLEEVGDRGRVRGGGAKGRYMCKVEGKWGKKEAERVGEVVNEVCGLWAKRGGG
jgi:alanyl-tRNA synthetase/misacylated tRNA(Ala) deacylase